METLEFEEVIDDIRMNTNPTPTAKINPVNFETKNNNSLEPTDGGYGWIVVLSSFLVMLVVLGTLYSYGIFLQHYSKIYATTTSLPVLSLIGTLATSLCTLLTVYFGRLNDQYGSRICIVGGGIFIGLGLILASFSTHIWQLFLTQGLMVGLGSSLATCGAVTLPSQWFLKRRGLATGIAVSGSGLGGLMLAPLTQFLLDNFGLRWTLISQAGLNFVVLFLSAVLVRQRIPPLGCKLAKFNLHQFKNFNFNMLFLAGIFFAFNYLIPFYLMPNYCIRIGLSPQNAAILVGILNFGSFLGRILLGYFADLIGKLNLIFICMFFSCLLYFLVWNFAYDFATLLVFNLMYGFFAGGYISSTPTVVATIFGVESLASNNGLLSFSLGIPLLLGTAIAYTTADSLTTGPTFYLPVITFGGTCALLSSIFLLILKFNVSKKLLDRV